MVVANYFSGELRNALTYFNYHEPCAAYGVPEPDQESLRSATGFCGN